MLSLSPGFILMAALVILASITTIAVIRILRSVQELVVLGETRSDLLRKELDLLTGVFEIEETQSSITEGERECREHPEDPEGPESLPVAGAQRGREQNVAIEHRADKLEQDVLQLQRDYSRLAEDLKQVREQQREADQERERVLEGLRNIQQILNGRLSVPN